MKRLVILFLVLFLITAPGCTKKSGPDAAAEKFHTFLKDGKYAEAYDMTDQTTKDVIPREKFVAEAKRVGSLALFTKRKPAQINNEKTEAIIFTEFTGKKANYNQLPDAKITFHLKKAGNKWLINMKDMITDVKKEEAQNAIEIPISPELLEAGKTFKEKIEIKDVKNGEVEFDNGLSQYMMEATIKNNSDTPFSYIGAKVKFMNDDETKVLFEKTFFLVYTRQIQGIYPLKPGEERNVIIPGYDAGDIEGNWTGKLQWDVHAVKVATDAELITMEELDKK